MRKRLCAILLAAAMVFALSPVSAVASSAAEEERLYNAAPATLTLLEQLKRREIVAARGGVAYRAIGDADDPFVISNAAQLAELAARVNAQDARFTGASYVLANDIDLSAYAPNGIAGDAYEFGWVPIGVYSAPSSDNKPFKGTFDGQGYSVTGLVIDNGGANGQGLFGYLEGGGCVVRNLSVTANIKGYSYVGGVAGFVGNQANVQNCRVTGAVSGFDSVGGAAGAVNNGSVLRCGVAAAVSSVSTSTNSTVVGGVAGWANGATIRDCYATGAVAFTGRSAQIGGVVGAAMNRTEIVNCYATGAVSGNAGDAGGVLGVHVLPASSAASTIANCVALNPSVSGSGNVGFVTGNQTASGCFAWQGMTVPAGANPAATPLDYDASLGLNASGAPFAWSGFTAENGWNPGDGNTLPTLQDLPGGAQQSALPAHITRSGSADLTISTPAQLAAFAAEVNGGDDFAGKTVLLMNDVDLSAYAPGKTVDGVVYYDGWVPIGIYDNSNPKPFRGTFDGLGNSVTGLVIDGSAAPVSLGLFGFLQGTVQNLTVEADVTGSNYVGGVAGRAHDATISDCRVTGNINGLATVAGVAGYIERTTVERCVAAASIHCTGNCTGGVVGFAKEYSTITDCLAAGDVHGVQNGVGGVSGYIELSTIQKCRVTGAVSGGENNVGGVVGQLSGNGTIENCCVTGAVSGTGSDVGGVVGEVWRESGGDITLQNCYVTGAVSGQEHVGGVVGRDESELNTTFTLQNCYATGAVSGTGSGVGGVLGHIDYAAGGPLPTVANCVALNPAVSGAGDVGRGMGNDSSTSGFAWGRMTTPASVRDDGFTLLDYSDSQGLNASGAPFAWSGFTAANGWIPGDGKSLPTLRDLPGGAQQSALPPHITGEADLCITTPAQLAAFADAVNGGDDFSGKTVWLMNDVDLSAYAPNGIAGDPYEFGWVPIGDSDSAAFRGTFDGRGNSVTGLQIERPSGGNLEGLFGMVEGGTVQNLSVAANVKGRAYVGGVAGSAYNNSVIKNCFVTGAIEGNERVGGVVGNLRYNSRVELCGSAAEVNGSQYYGGVAGEAQNDATIDRCFSTGEVNVGRYGGGVVGLALSNTIVQDCYATGDVAGTNYFGGVAGAVNNATLQRCYATGNVLPYVSTSTSGGGVAGSVISATVTHCVSLNPAVAGASDIGYVTGTGTATDSFAWGGTALTGTANPDEDPGWLALRDGFLHEGADRFDWAGNGFTAANGWTVPNVALALPYLTGTSDRPTLSLASSQLVDYIDYVGDRFVDRAADAQDLTASGGDVTLTAGAYVVRKSDSPVVIGGALVINGDVRLILEDGCSLVVERGVTINDNAQLTFCAQSRGDDMGRMNVLASGNTPGFRGETGTSSLTINGGFVTVDYYAAPPRVVSVGDLIINGGVFDARGQIESGSVVTGANGNPVVFAGSFTNPLPSADQLNGVVFVGRNGTVYGTPEMTCNLGIRDWHTLDIPANCELTIGDGTLMTNYGTLTVKDDGTLTIKGDAENEDGGKLVVEPGGTVNKKAQSAPADAPTAASVTRDSVALNPMTGGKAGVEYRKGGDTAYQGETFTGLTVGVTYTFFARHKEGDYYAASPDGPESAAYTLTDIVATPVANPPAGTYTRAQTVTLSCLTPGATIRYTLGGAEPTATSGAYTAPIAVYASTTLKAKAFLTGYRDSATLTAAYVIQPTLPCTVVPAAFQEKNAPNVLFTVGAGTPLQPGDLKDVRLNAKALSPVADYDVASGSIVVTLRRAYLNTLKPGVYTLRATMNDGAFAEAKLTVTARPPATGDGGTPALWLLLCALGAAGVAIALIARKRRVRA